MTAVLCCILKSVFNHLHLAYYDHRPAASTPQELTTLFILLLYDIPFKEHFGAELLRYYPPFWAGAWVCSGMRCFGAAARGTVL